MARLAWLLLLSGCALGRSTPPITFYAAPDGFELSAPTADDPERLFDPLAGRIDLLAAANEVVAFRLAITHSAPLPVDVSVSVEDFTSEAGAVLPASSVQIFRVYSVRVPSWPGWHLRMVPRDERRELVDDLLIPAHAPIGGLPARMPRNEALDLWVDVRVPPDAASGVYLSKLQVRTGRAAAPASLAIRLEVLPASLPDAVDVVLAADLDHEQIFAHHVRYAGRPYRPGRVLEGSPVRGELHAALDTAMRLLQSHGVWPLLPGLYPVMKIDADGQVSVNWKDYDALVEGYLDGTRLPDGASAPLWAVPFDERFPTPPSREALASPAYSGYVRQYLAECARHFAERGWLERGFVRVPHAPAHSPEAIAATQHFAALIRRAAPELRIVSELFPQDMTPYGWTGFSPVPRTIHDSLTALIDVWCPRAQFLPAPAIRNQVSAAAMFWMRLDRPPFSGSLDLAAGPTDARVVPWQARQEDVAVVRLGWVNHWPAAPEGRRRLSAQDCVAFAAAGTESTARRAHPLIYPGGIAGLSEPLPSIRLKRLRRGMHDLAWLHLLKGRGADHIAEVLAESLAPFAAARAYRHHYADGRAGGWVREPRAWREAERVIIDEVRATGADDLGRIGRMAATVRWRRLMEAARLLRIEVESARVRVIGQGPLTESSVECTLWVRNGTREPVSGSARFGLLPLGWVAPEKPAPFGPIAPGGAGRIVLSAQAAAIPWNEDGVQLVPVELKLGDREEATRHVTVRLVHVAAQPLERKPARAGRAAGERIRIDGDLSDWPTGAGNLASDFVPISASAESDRAATPNARTRVSIAADEEALYFAFDCAFGPGGGPAPSGHTNTVRYEDLIPVGGELVEIILDPTAAGTHSPADLYHVVVKPGGALWERGVGFDPPVGPREPWAADIQHAARTGSSGWTAELRIPFAAFDPAARRQPIWAVNFSRYDARSDEYSTWSGAAGNFYDPAAAGNLALP